MALDAEPGLMRAARVHEGGEVRVEEAPDPVAGEGEVLVELRAAALNRRDLLVRNPPGPAYDFPKPFVAGHDGAGVRRDTGEEVVLYPGVGWGPDDQVPAGLRWLGGPLDGTFAELVAVPEECVFPKPARLSWEEAASLPVAGMTAYRALFPVGGLRSGETVLVLGAGSGASTFAIALAAQAGARVLVTSSSEEKIERSRELGAGGGVLYTQDDWAAAVRELAPDGVDLVIDSVGSTWPDSLRALRKGGRLVVFGGTGGATAELDVRFVYLNWLSILGTTGASPRQFGAFLETAQAGTWHPVIDSVHPLDEVDAAYEALKAVHYGKVVLSIEAGPIR
ncbi:MAG TPA: zinc-binding dehydrogenase [Gaiellaceae bacterium]|nr:zinc-binding dehydrogenase [Gaiellaceae bacterium]